MLIKLSAAAMGLCLYILTFPDNLSEIEELLLTLFLSLSLPCEFTVAMKLVFALP
jgi:hypothetical protein